MHGFGPEDCLVHESSQPPTTLFATLHQPPASCPEEHPVRPLLSTTSLHWRAVAESIPGVCWRQNIQKRFIVALNLYNCSLHVDAALRNAQLEIETAVETLPSPRVVSQRPDQTGNQWSRQLWPKPVSSLSKVVHRLESQQQELESQLFWTAVGCVNRAPIGGA